MVCMRVCMYFNTIGTCRHIDVNRNNPNFVEQNDHICKMKRRINIITDFVAAMMLAASGLWLSGCSGEDGNEDESSVTPPANEKNRGRDYTDGIPASRNLHFHEEK